MSFQEYSDSLQSKLRLGNMNKKLVVGIAILALIAICLCVYTLFLNSEAYSNTDDEIAISNVDESQESSNEAGESGGSDSNENASERIYVHVAGCVKNPGVYELDASSRANEAIEAAGGFTKTADTEAINLAESLSDGQQIIVPKKSSSSAAETSSTNSTANSQTSSSASQSSSELVNINTATSEQLQTLSGIGEAKAQKIIEYREQNGPFESVDSLTNVSGIGEKTLESLRPYICI